MSAEFSTTHVSSVEVVDVRNTHTTSPLIGQVRIAYNDF